MSLEMLSLFDYFLIIILSLSTFFSFMRGFVQSLLGLLTWIGAVIITLIFYENLGLFLSNYLNKIKFLEQSGLSVIISTIISIPFIFLVSLIILKKIRKMISTDFQKSSLGNFFDKIFGIIYGFAFGAVLISILIITMNNVSDNFSSSSFVNNSYFYPYLNILNEFLLEYTPLILNETNTVIDNNISD